MNSEECFTIGEKLRAYRKAKGLTQKELAQGICSHSSISQMELGNLTGAGRRQTTENL